MGLFSGVTDFVGDAWNAGKNIVKGGANLLFGGPTGGLVGSTVGSIPIVGPFLKMGTDLLGGLLGGGRMPDLGGMASGLMNWAGSPAGSNIMSLLGLGADVGGSYLEAKDLKEMQRRNLDFSKKQFAEQIRQYDRSQSYTIRDRVADARAAGIHPLAALGVSPTPSSSSYIPGQSESGSALGRGLQRLAAAVNADAMQRAQIRGINASAKRDEAEAALALSRAKRAEQEANHNQESALGSGLPPKYIQVHNPFTGKTEWIPNPDIFELPETIGAAMYGRATAEDARTGVNPLVIPIEY